MTLLDRAKKGEIIDDIEIYDAHAHLGKWYCITMRKSEQENLIKIMKDMKFQKMTLSSSLAICSDFRAGNQEMQKAVQAYPDHLLGYVTVNANYKDGLIEEVLKYESEKNIIGLKIHPSYSGVLPDDDRYRECYEYADKHRKLILVHTFNRGDVNILSGMFDRYPHIRFIIGHSGAEDGVELTAKLIREYKNVYSDLPVSFAPNNTLEYLAEQGDDNKIFFGTDAPLFDYRITYGRVLFSNLSDVSKKKVMGMNFKQAISHLI